MPRTTITAGPSAPAPTGPLSPNNPILSADDVKILITNNNPYKLGNNIVTYFVNLGVFQELDRWGILDELQTVIVDGLQTHADPAMFIANALICIGNVSQIKMVQAEYELAISQWLSVALGILVEARDQRNGENYKHKSDQDQNLLMDVTSSNGVPQNCNMDSHSSPFSYNRSKVANDLMVFDDNPIITGLEINYQGDETMSTNGHGALVMTVWNGAGANLLDGDPDSDLIMAKPLKPHSTDLIDFEDWDKPSILKSTPSLSAQHSTVSLIDSCFPLKPPSKHLPDLLMMDTLTDLTGGEAVKSESVTEAALLANGNENMPIEHLHDVKTTYSNNSLIDLWDLDIMKDPNTTNIESHAGKRPSVPSEDLNASQLVEALSMLPCDLQQLSSYEQQGMVSNSDQDANLAKRHIPDDLLSLESESVQLPSAEQTQEPQEWLDGQENGQTVGEEEKRSTLIGPQHRQKLLDEISFKKSVLQVYTAIEVFELQKDLKQPMRDMTYGGELARQLFEMKRYGECAFVLSHYLGYETRATPPPNASVIGCKLEMDLVPRLLERKDITDLLSNYVSGDYDACFRVLDHINYQLDFIFQEWSISTKDLLQPNQEHFTDVLPIHQIWTPGVQTTLVMAALQLVVNLGLFEHLHPDLDNVEKVVELTLEPPRIIQERCPVLSIFIRFCYIVTLLDISATDPPLPNKDVNSRLMATKDQETDLWLFDPDTDPTSKDDKGGAGGDENGGGNETPYYVTRIIQLVDTNTILQQILIHYCLVVEDAYHARYFTEKLNLEAIYKERSQIQERKLARRRLWGDSSTATMARVAPESAHLAVPPSSTSRSGSRATTASGDPAFNRNKTVSGHGQRASPTPRALTPFPSVPLHLLPYYELPTTARIVVVDGVARLKELSRALRQTRVVGMDTEWLPDVPRFEHLRPGQRTAIVQLACDYIDTVFLVDVLAFLDNPEWVHAQDDSQDYLTPQKQLVHVLGSLFSDPNIRKIAYDWVGDQELLERTLPELMYEEYKLRNFMDMKTIRLEPPKEDKTIPIGSPLSSVPSAPSSPSSIISARIQAKAKAKVKTKMEAVTLRRWTTKGIPTWTPMVTGGLSGMLGVLGSCRLNKAQQCSNWEQRPLDDAQARYAASDAMCLLKIYEVLQNLERC
ncbi:Exonuclease mut-7 [Lunasporangiospora selenospora]|uniref:Exonuclease mut-7 n=1 Tax=Lunasporangiospora selenospora TaxID=979761 RepID=A0A9P6FZB5_9FUNG|nr:Exonuclease mut-7 [Lunasporangiospora selenospora]